MYMCTLRHWVQGYRQQHRQSTCSRKTNTCTRPSYVFTITITLYMKFQGSSGWVSNGLVMVTINRLGRQVCIARLFKPWQKWWQIHVYVIITSQTWPDFLCMLKNMVRPGYEAMQYNYYIAGYFLHVHRTKGVGWGSHTLPLDSCLPPLKCVCYTMHVLHSSSPSPC